MLDLLIRGARIVDGTGAPARQGDVAVRNGRIVADGAGEPAAKTIDADGLVVSPGFIDAHSHIDPQVFWDPFLQPSPQHGTTSMIAGNCGFSIAPAPAEARDYILRMFARTEGLPFDLLDATVNWTWDTPEQMLDGLDQAGLGANVGLLVGHSTLRRTVMGERAISEKATPEDVDQMKALLRKTLAAGFMGLSTSRTVFHKDHNQNPVPSRWASDEELLDLCSVVGEYPGTTLESSNGGHPWTPEEMDLAAAMSLAANRPHNTNLYDVASGQPDLWKNRIESMERAREKGACFKWLLLPQNFQVVLTFAIGYMLDSFPGWAGLFTIPLEDRIRRLRNPQDRARLRDQAATLTPADGNRFTLVRWKDYRVAETFSPANHGLAGKTIGEIAASRGIDPFEAFVEVALVDDLSTTFDAPLERNTDETWRLRAQFCQDPRFLVGGSDAGGHVNMMCGAAMTTIMLSEFRDRGLMTIEQMVHQLSDRLARYYGLRGRGRIADGYWADLVIFDERRVGPAAPTIKRDLPPNGGMRIWQDSIGIEHVFVNGTEVVIGGKLTGDRPGKVMRSGRDLDTVDLAAGLAI